MKPLILLAFLAVSACTQPMLSADMAVDSDGLSVRPTFSGIVGDTTISVQSN